MFIQQSNAHTLLIMDGFSYFCSGVWEYIEGGGGVLVLLLAWAVGMIWKMGAGQ